MLILLIPLFYVLKKININYQLNINIVTNLLCGIVVALVTAICQYFISKRRIINNTYRLYFDLYREFYFFKQQIYTVDGIKTIINKLSDTKSKINDELGEYSCFINGKNSFINKLYSKVSLDNIKVIKNKMNPKAKIYNDKCVIELIDYLFEFIKEKLNIINTNKFNKDSKKMIEEFNYIWN